MKLFTLILIFNLLIPNISFSIDNTHFQKARSEFELLKKQWDKESRDYAYSSNPYDYWKGEAASAIVLMGKRALPFVFEEIEKGNIFFNVAAERITEVGINYEGPNSWQALSVLWLNWWDKNKTTKEWNLFLTNK